MVYPFRPVRGAVNSIILTAIFTTSTPRLAVLSSKMTNFSDPVVQLKDFGAYAFALGARLWTLDSGPTDPTFLNSGSPELLAHNDRDLYVRVLYCVNLLLSCTSIRTSSWEYVTTLDFELDIIRGRRSYRWTIWVCSDRRFFACHYLSFEIRADLPVR